MRKEYNSNPVLYATWYEALRELAIGYGYVACIHGSLLNDMDIVLVPWEESAANPLDLLLKMKEVTGAELIYFFPVKVGEDLSYAPVLYPNVPDLLKANTPHGRECWALKINNKMYIDISIMPRSKP